MTCMSATNDFQVGGVLSICVMEEKREARSTQGQRKGEHRRENSEGPARWGSRKGGLARRLMTWVQSLTDSIKLPSHLHMHVLACKQTDTHNKEDIKKIRKSRKERGKEKKNKSPGQHL